MAKTKVCFVITKGVWGGAQKYVYSLAVNLNPENYDVSVICGQGNELPKKLEEKGIRVHRITELERDISIKKELKNLIQIFKLIKKESPDVLHLNSPKVGGLGAVVGRILGVKKIIFTSHGFAFNEKRPLFHKVLIRFFSWLTLVLNKKIILISNKEKKDTLGMPFIGPEKIVLINNGIEKIDFKEKNIAREHLLSKLSNKPEIPTNAVWIGTLSELHKNKGLEYAINAVAKLTTPFVFFIVGVGEEKTNLEKIIKNNNLENKVFLTGFVDNANQYLKAFDIFTLTSVKEGLPYTILEAGLSETPIVASNIGGIPDVIDNGINGILVTKERPGEIQRAIEYMLDHKEERETFAKKLKEKVEKNFSLEQMLEKTIALY